MSTTCAVAECDSTAHARSWCRKHHTRWLRTGDPLGVRRSGRRPTHGMARTAIYKAWASMKGRCENATSAAWDDYGGRGITVHPEWSASFEAFYAYVGPRPDNMTLDRIDVNGNYEPGNVRWVTRAEQTRNRRPFSEWRNGGVAA